MKRLLIIAMLLTSLVAEGRTPTAHPRSIRNANVLNPKDDSTWEEARRVEHEDFVRREDARLRREVAEREWTEKDYWIAIRVIRANNNATIAHRTKPYTEAQYKKAIAIRDIYEERHPDIRRHGRTEPVTSAKRDSVDSLVVVSPPAR